MPAGVHRIAGQKSQEDGVGGSVGVELEARDDVHLHARLAQHLANPGHGAVETIADQDQVRAHRFDPPSSAGSCCWTRLLGMAKPTPTLPSTGLSIDWVMPI